jgi:hypothetical protein
MVPFRYVEFYDVPRVIAFWYKSKFFLLQSTFDEELDDYPENYSVHILPASVEPLVSASHWEFLEDEDLDLDYVGEIPVKDIRFDETKRKELDASVLDRLLVS